MKKIFTLIVVVLSLTLLTNAQTFNSHIDRNIEFSVYPNPAVDEVSVSISKPVAEANLNIYNALGDLVFQQQIHRNIQQVKVDLSEFQKGIYIVQINGKETKVTKKLIVK